MKFGEPRCFEVRTGKRPLNAKMLKKARNRELRKDKSAWQFEEDTEVLAHMRGKEMLSRIKMLTMVP